MTDYDQGKMRAILLDELTALKERISANIEAAGQSASGKTQEGMRVTATGQMGVLTGRQAFSTLERGSFPWTRKYKRTPLWFAEIIQQWLEDKNLDRKLNAWAVATRIRLEGSQLHRDGGRADIYSPEIETALTNIRTRIGDYFAVLATSSLVINKELEKL